MEAHGSPPADASVMVEVRGLRQSFGGVVAVADANATFPAHQITGLIGPNGAGKSTMLNLIAGTIRTQRGEIILDGIPIQSKSAHERARLGLARTFQMSSEFKRLTVIENLVCGARLRRGESLRSAVLGPWWWREDERQAVERAVGILDTFGLLDKAEELAGSLSGGERRLVEVGRALMADPKVLLLDEPLAGVHPRNVGRIIDALVGLQARGITVITCLHEPDAVERLCSTVIVMAQGAVIASGPFDLVREDNEVLAAYLG